MKLIMKKTIVAFSIISLFALTSCTGEPSPEETVTEKEITSVINTYKTTVEDIYNHGYVEKDFVGIQETITGILDTQDYEIGYNALLNKIPMDNILVPDEPAKKISACIQVLSLMVVNTENDTVSALVDRDAVTITGDTAQISYKGVTFESINNADTGMADMLNGSYQYKKDNNVVFEKVNGEWKIDPETILPPMSY